MEDVDGVLQPGRARAIADRICTGVRPVPRSNREQAAESSRACSMSSLYPRAGNSASLKMLLTPPTDPYYASVMETNRLPRWVKPGAKATQATRHSSRYISHRNVIVIGVASDPDSPDGDGIHIGAMTPDGAVTSTVYIADLRRGWDRE